MSWKGRRRKWSWHFYNVHEIARRNRRKSWWTCGKASPGRDCNMGPAVYETGCWPQHRVGACPLPWRHTICRFFGVLFNSAVTIASVVQYRMKSDGGWWYCWWIGRYL